MADRRSIIGLMAVLALASMASQWWVQRQQGRLGEQVAALAAPGDLQMMSSVSCGICTQARMWFTEHQVRFDECFIEKDAACAARLESMRAPGTPVIVVRGQAQLGFDPQRLLAALQRP